MPIQSFSDTAKFVDDYNKFLSYTSYMRQWSDTVRSLGTQLAADPLFVQALSAQEQADLTTAVNAAVTASVALPVKPIENLVGPA